MKRLSARPAIALLTFVVGVALVSAYLLLQQNRQATPPCNTVEVATAPAPVAQATAKEETHDEAPQGPFVKVGELPDQEAGEGWDFSVAFVNESAGWLAKGAKLWRTGDGGASWELVYSKGKASRSDPECIDDFRFTSPDEGWLLANSHLYRTRDGGRTWRSLDVPEVDGYLAAVDFLPGGKVGWLGGNVCGALRKDEWAANRFHCSAASNTASFAAVFKTRDGGRTWQRERVSRATGTIVRLRMRSARSGFATGQAGAFSYEGGRWLDAESQLPDAPEWERKSGEGCLEIAIGLPTYCPVSFHFNDEKHGWLSNANGYLGRTSDGGRTWTDIARAPDVGGIVDPPFFIDLYIGADGSGMALDTDGDLQETSDGGVTWECVTERGSFKSMFALDAERVWLVAADGLYRLKGSTKSP
ncbi:MAG: hypothetical protein ACJ74T_07620 [Pyrinomonadaceae bacterium]